jgi:glycine cleavage system aminomethyltransferase T
VLELRETRAELVTCVADAAAIDAVAAAGVSADVFRVAPDEALVVSDADRDALVDEVARAAMREDRDAVVVDATDGWSVWAIEGDAATQALVRLSRLDPVAGFAQGEVGRVPAKVVVEPSRIRVLVPAMWGETVRRRILADCADLDVREAGPVSWTVTR